MNAVIYARYSSDSQREESIEGQLRECREYRFRFQVGAGSAGTQQGKGQESLPTPDEQAAA